jgi:hypothetical protein
MDKCDRKAGMMHRRPFNIVILKGAASQLKVVYRPSAMKLVCGQAAKLMMFAHPMGLLETRI